ncbi:MULTISPECIES: transglycosylase SLT domain-containing protein [Streptomyces]|uniref:transglycosylase SLT domain-containing protein n=1 Tax=Streptomyces TaxID=1883 RepID=UPI00031731AC|nr:MULTISPECIES: transglycosylase SLT domain-containing protein [Streptomyces]MYR37002.1 transglycosylase SLT domain-containing protein [Streptomyces sp. SID4944]MBT3078240.1 transglycosylase SLT domain-containing protein [Streptomyces sp. COG21]MBT3080363.1 transglycosylase SLT domain-containing protein [Streptomyces sp. COG20]MBT3087220.1 transglycosylase SLT domain-containing protein [Streptomyces sp. CYG21]MBT3098895.1 transglycosylase SLT domain-containing protein [Streptomyces sp. CBG30]
MPRTIRITRSHKLAAAVLVAAGSVTAITATGGQSEAQPTAATSSATAEKAATGASTAKESAAKKAAAENAAKKAAADAAAAKKAAADRKAEAKKAAAKERSEKQAANRSTERKAVAAPKKAAPKAAPKKYANNLDGWIRESLDIMKKKNIPGSYEGLHRNIMRESSGNPNAVNDWDINARNGIPSKGLLQVIQPTFDAYHVKGTPKKLTDPVANITAAANYAADRYGSIDNVDSAY